ncbi:MAG: DUF4178 domain-containing protein [Myxococcaceae bacterium]
MSQGQCPSCGSPIAFTAGTALVVVCAHCQTVVGRKGAALEAHGKIGAIVDTDSPLQLGVHGVFDGAGYRVVGHLQKDHGAGPWDEWYIEFDDGERGWVSESEGAFHLLRYQGEDTAHPLSALKPGEQLRIGTGQSFVVEEVGHARTVAAAGELPSDVDPEAEGWYVDATGAGGLFCTLDYGTGEGPAELYVGERVELDRLGIPPDQLRPRVKKVALVQARCTQCNGPLELRAPDRSRRVACPYCGALLDVSHGKLAFLQALEKPKREPLIPLGRKGVLDGAEWICIGFLVRSCEVEYERYDWEEYLLFNRARGFTWLSQSEGHWTFLVPVAAGDVFLASGRVATYQRRAYKAFSSVTAQTDFVLGEFYWEVNAGEQAHVTEYVLPPYSLSEDRTENETTFSHGEYLTPEKIRAAFGVEKLPQPVGIAPSQPNPARARMRNAFKWAGIYAVALVALYALFNAVGANHLVFEQRITVPPGVRGGTPESMFFSEPFEIPRRGNVQVELRTPVNNDWLGVQGDLVNEATQEVTSFYAEASFYSGSDSEGSWSEGNRSATEYLSAIPAGRYVLRLTPMFDAARTDQARSYDLGLTSNVPRFLWFFLAFVALWIPALFNLVRTTSFETARWNESSLHHGEHHT